jgi:hypothetical protein
VQHHFEQYGTDSYRTLQPRRVAHESHFRLMKTSSWTNDIDVRDTHTGDTLGKETSLQKQTNGNKVGNVIRKQSLQKRQRILGKHLHPMYEDERLTNIPVFKTRLDKRVSPNAASLSTESHEIPSPRIVHIDSCEKQSDVTLENRWLLKDGRKFTDGRKTVCRRSRNIETLEENRELERKCPVKRMTRFPTEEDTGIPHKPRLHKIHMSCIPVRQSGNLRNFKRI